MKDATLLTLAAMLCLTLIAVIHDAELLFPIVMILAAGGGIGTAYATYQRRNALGCAGCVYNVPRTPSPPGGGA